MMRATCDTNKVIACIETIAQAASWRDGPEDVPLLLHAVEDRLDIRLGLGQTVESATVPAMVQRHGTALAPGAPLLALMQQITSEQVGFSTGKHEGTQCLYISANGRKYRLPPVTEASSPAWNSVAEASVVMVGGKPSDDTGSMLRRVLSARPTRMRWSKQGHDAPPLPATSATLNGAGERPRSDASADRAIQRDDGASRAWSRLWDGRVLAAASLALLGTVFVAMPTGVREALLVAGVALACLIPVAGTRSRRGSDLVELGVAIGFVYFVLFAVRAGVVLGGFDGATNSRVITAGAVTHQKALIFVALGLCAGGLMYLLPQTARLARRIPQVQVGALELPSARVAFAAFLLGAVAQAIVLAAYWWPERVSIIAGRASGLVSATTALLLIGLCLLARRAAVTGKRSDLVRLGAAIALAVAVGLGGAFKEIAILGILVPLLMWHLTRPRGVSVRWFAAATVAVVFLIFPFVSLWRAASDRIDSADPRDVVVELPHQTLDRDWVTGGPHSLEATDALTSPLALTSHRLYGFDSMVLLVRYTPSEVPHQDGATLLNLAAGLVPRIFWADKPNIGIGYWFGESYWGTPEGVPVVAQAITHPGELYVDFGVVGVIVGMAILGLWYRLAWEALRPRASAAAALIYTIVFATVVVVDRDLPLVYITLVQRLAVVGLFLGALALIGRITPRRTA